jgi:hypothetical protein
MPLGIAGADAPFRGRLVASDAARAAGVRLNGYTALTKKSA